MKRFAIGMCVAALAALVTTGWAAKEVITSNTSYPSVDEDGSFNSMQNQGNGSVKLSVNTKNRKFTIKGKGQTTNNSGKSQTFNNNPQAEGYFESVLAFDVFILNTTKSKFKVNKKGGANISLKGTAEAAV